MTELTKHLFLEQLNTSFQVEYASGQLLELTLIEVREGRSSPQQEIFAPTFLGPSTPLLAHYLFPCRHPAIGNFELFLVAIGQDERGILYEAVFNRLISKGGH